MPDHFNECLENLRQAIAAGHYSEAERLATECCSKAESAHDPALVGEAIEVLEKARRSTLANRAGLAARLATLRSWPRAYAATRPAAHTWDLEG